MKKKTEQEFPDDVWLPGDKWLIEPERSITFQTFMDSLQDKKVKRVSTYLPQKLERNWSTNRR